MVAVRICVDFHAGTEDQPAVGYDDGVDGPDVGEDGPSEDEEPALSLLSCQSARFWWRSLKPLLTTGTPTEKSFSVILRDLTKWE